MARTVSVSKLMGASIVASVCEDESPSPRCVVCMWAPHYVDKPARLIIRIMFGFASDFICHLLDLQKALR